MDLQQDAENSRKNGFRAGIRSANKRSRSGQRGGYFICAGTAAGTEPFVCATAGLHVLYETQTERQTQGPPSLHGNGRRTNDAECEISAPNAWEKNEFNASPRRGGPGPLQINPLGRKLVKRPPALYPRPFRHRAPKACLEITANRELASLPRILHFRGAARKQGEEDVSSDI